MGIKDSTDIQTSQRLWYKCFYERVTCFECTRTNAQNCAGNSRQGKFLALFKSFFADYQQPFIERQRVQLRTASEGIIRDNFQVVGTDNFFQNLAMAKCRPIDMTNTFSEMYFLKALTAVQGILSDVGNTVRNLDLRQAIASGKASLSEIFQLLRLLPQKVSYSSRFKLRGKRGFIAKSHQRKAATPILVTLSGIERSCTTPSSNAPQPIFLVPSGIDPPPPMC